MQASRLTVDGQVAQRSTCRSLDLVVMAAKQEEDRVECIPSDLPDLLLGDFGKGKGGGTL